MLDRRSTRAADRARDARRLDQVFRALAHPVRREILSRLGAEERSISDLAAPFDMTLEAVSQHVRVLERARLLRRSKHGRVHRCRMDPAPLRDAGAVLVQLAGFWDQQLDSLERWLRAPEEKS
ncbi:MAG TPA: metalloregulator ArsR/SmtB family transcription factor [Kofleriaceae bacterium]|jgi:DNA-binding transcriptional ArsR family regulator|nr:metalloregulator ArsR/SmtB family transcription factor [Kofleriaceae bacterium]